MNSSFLCVIVIGFLFQVFAKDRFHSKLYWTNLEKINEEIETNTFVVFDRPPRIKAKKTKSYLVCSKKIGVSPDTILSIKRGNWADDDQKAKAWVRCVLMENELMTDQSVFRLDVAFEYLSRLEKKSLEENVDKCLPNKPMPPVEISWQFAKCFQKADPENSLF